jgi:hypothetical protein
VLAFSQVVQYRLRHANVLPVFGVVVDDVSSITRLIVERGVTSLAGVVNARGPGGLTLETVLPMFADVLRGLVFMHSRRPHAVVHCTAVSILRMSSPPLTFCRRCCGQGTINPSPNPSPLPCAVDLKPENVLLTIGPDGRHVYKLCDVGGSKVTLALRRQVEVLQSQSVV